METGIYLPFINFTLGDDIDLNRMGSTTVLYENIVQSGPSYRLIVHDSPEWRELSEQISSPEKIFVISEQESRKYADLAKKFFSPITEAASYYEVDGRKQPMINLTRGLRRALSYVLIGYDYNARIFDDTILEIDDALIGALKKNRIFTEEAIRRAEFVVNLLKGYRRDSITSLSINCEAKKFDELVTALEREEVKELSGLNHLFGAINVEKNALKRSVKQKVTQIIKNRWFPHAAGAIALGLSYIPNLLTIGPIISFLTDVGAQELSNYDFKEYAPPIQDPKLYMTQRGGEGSIFSYGMFNYDFLIKGVTR